MRPVKRSILYKSAFLKESELCSLIYSFTDILLFMLRRSIYLLSVCLLFALPGCNLINPEEEIPTYLRVDSFQYLPAATFPATSSHKINSVYVYDENYLMGVWELPALIPVQTKDAGKKLLLLPGVDYNGIRSQQSIYPFFSGDTLTVHPEPGQVIPYTAKTGYVTNAQMLWSENFELSNKMNVKLSGDTVIIPVTGPGQVFEGARSGGVFLTGEGQSSESISTDGFAIDYRKETFLELNYKNTVPVQIGLLTTPYALGEPYYEYIIGLKPSENWNKVYVDLRPFAGNFQGAQYRLVLRVHDEGGAAGYALFDNLQVVSYE